MLRAILSITLAAVGPNHAAHIEPRPRVAAHTSVTPDGGFLNQLASYQTYQATFTVTNSGSEWDTYTFNCAVSGTISSCTVLSNGVDLAPNCSVNIVVSYTTAAVGSGTLSMTAWSAARHPSRVHVGPLT